MIHHNLIVYMVVVVLLILAIVLSVMSLAITLNISAVANRGAEFRGGSQTGQVSLVILPPEGIENEAENK